MPMFILSQASPTRWKLRLSFADESLGPHACDLRPAESQGVEFSTAVADVKTASLIQAAIRMNLHESTVTWD